MDFQEFPQYSSSSKLMGAVRALNYLGQYKVCFTFYDEIVKYPRWHNSKYCILFDELYEAIDPDYLDESILRIHQCINEIDNILSEMDVKDPGSFFQISRVLEPIIDSSTSTVSIKP